MLAYSHTFLTYVKLLLWGSTDESQTWQNQVMLAFRYLDRRAVIMGPTGEVMTKIKRNEIGGDDLQDYRKEAWDLFVPNVCVYVPDDANPDKPPRRIPVMKLWREHNHTIRIYETAYKVRL